MSTPMPEFVSSTFADIAAGEPLARPATASDTARRSARTPTYSSRQMAPPISTYTGGPSPQQMARSLAAPMTNNNSYSNPNLSLTLTSVGRPPATPSGMGLVPELDEKPLDHFTPRTAYDMKR
jgi:hypothetical protein